MPKTLTVRMDDATYSLIAEAAEADNRSVSNFIETAAREKAMAEAFRKGNMGIMDYQRIQNIQADTDMRTSIAKPDEGKK